MQAYHLGRHRQPLSRLAVLILWHGMRNQREKRRSIHEMGTQSFDAFAELVLAEVLQYDRADRGPSLPVVDEEVPQLWLMAEAERMDSGIRSEIFQREHEWLDYTCDEAAVIYDVADALLADLLKDTIDEVQQKL